MKWSLLDTEEETTKEIPRGEESVNTRQDLVNQVLPGNDNNLEVEPPSKMNGDDTERGLPLLSQDTILGVGPLNNEPARISLLSHFSFTFLIIAIVAGALAGAGWYFRDEVAAGFARFNTPVTALQKYTIRTLDDTATWVGVNSSVAIGRDGYPVISYTEYDYDQTNFSLKLYKCNDATCSSGTASTLDDPANQVGISSSLAIGRDGNPVISHSDNTAYSLKLYKCNDVACSTGTASTLDDPANYLFESDLAIGQDGYPVISYRDASAGSLKFYKCNDVACATGTASTLDDPANWVGENSSVAIGRDGYPVISYKDGNAGSLKFYKCNDVACSTGTASTLDDPANLVGANSSVAIGRDGYPVMSYYDETAYSLKLYKCNDVACSSGTASTLDDPANHVGLYTSLAIGRDGNPVISYYDETAQSLKLYKCNDAACAMGTAMTIDDPTNGVGETASLAIGNDGYPVISYYDFTNKSLKFAYVGNRVTMNTSPNTVVDDGLVGHWTFDGKDMTNGTNTVIDRSSSHATGTLMNMSLSSRVSGKHGQALQFDGVNDYVNAGSPSSLDDIITTTVVAWIKPRIVTGNIVSKFGVPLRGWGIGVSGFWKTVYVESFFTGTDGSWSGPYIRAGEWQHLVVIYDHSSASNVPIFYINGVATTTTVGTQSTGSYESDASDSLGIGMNPVFGSPFDGTLDDVRIYNRVLSADEIAELYGASVGTKQGICGEGGVRDADGNVYGIVQIGTQCWLDRNMNVGTRINVAGAQTNNATIEKYCYSDNDANCTTNHPKWPDGGLYQWDEAMQYVTTESARGLCPAGWHIPTDAEWYTLENYLKTNGATCDASRSGADDCTSAGTRLKPGGNALFEANLAGGDFWGWGDQGSFGLFWSSSPSGPTNAWYRSVGSGSSQVGRNAYNQSFSFSVRCIRDSN